MEKPRYDVFLSHATPDKPVVEELARLLKERGFEPWFDKWELVPGAPWQEAIQEALRNCATCAVCIGPSGTGPWQNAEMLAAINRRVSGERNSFRVIPVLLPGAGRVDRSQLSDFLTATTWVEFHETLDDKKALRRLLCGIQGIPPGPDPGEAVAEGACPYRGLQVFDVDDARFFFGREELTSRLLDKLGTDRAGTRFLAVVGPSGSGKSSLARAGLLASLKSGRIPGSDVWPVSICKPGAEPLQSLSLAFARTFRRDTSDALNDTSDALKLTRDLAADPHTLHIAAHLSLSDAPADRRLVVLVDQFEEAFTLCGNEGQRRALIDNLLYAATVSDGQTVVILTLRADFYGRCAAYPNLAAAVSDHQSLVGPMSREELRSAIQPPAYRAGCELEGGLADLLLNEVEAQPGSLPLLEHALLQIWQRREGGRRLTVAAYHEIGDVAGALEKHAEEVYGGFDEAEGEVCHQVFLKLVQVDEQGRATRRRLSRDDLVPETTEDGKSVQTVVARLIDARLLTSDQEKRPTVELAHEALLANWKRLKQWIDQDRDALRTRRRLDEAVTEWLGKDRDPSFLLEGGRLVQVEEWANGHPEEKTPERQELLAASIAERGKERQRELDQAKTLEEEQRRRADAEHQRAEEQTRARRRQKTWTFISLAATALALVAAGSTGYMWRFADQRQKVDLAGLLAEKYKLPFQQDPALALLLSIKAVRLAASGGQPHLPAAEEALRKILSGFRGLPLQTGRIRVASVSADHDWLAVAGADGTLSLWNLTRDGAVPKLSLPGNPADSSVEQIAVSPGGRWLLVSYEKGSHLFGIGKKQIPISDLDLKGEDWLTHDPFSPDGLWLLTRRGNGSWGLRELKDSLQTIAPLSIDPRTFGFSPDGRWLATAAESGTIQIWNLRQQPVTKPQFETTAAKQPEALAFSTDSQWLVVSQGDAGHRTVQAWNIDPLKGPGTPIVLKNCVWSSTPAPNNLDPTLASRILDLSQCLPGVHPMGPIPVFFDSTPITAVAVHPNGAGLFSVGSGGGVVGLANRNSVGFGIRTQIFGEGPIWLLSFQGKWLISQGGAAPPRLLEVLPGPDVAAIEPRLSSPIGDPQAVSPKGWRLSFNPRDHQARLWGPAGFQTFTAAERASLPWRFGPDGLWLAAAGGDGRPLVWKLGKDGIPSKPIPFSSQYHHSAAVSSLAISPDGRWIASGDAGGETRLWDLLHPKAEPHPLTNSQGGVTALAFSSDSRWIAQAAGRGPVRLRGLEDDGPAAADRPGPPEGYLGSSTNSIGTPITALVFLPDGRLALGGSGERVHLWDPDGHDTFLDGKVAGISALAVNPQGDHLASVSLNGIVQIWAREGRDFRRESVQLTGDSVQTLAFTSDGNRLLTLSKNGTLKSWELRTDKLLAAACKAVGRNLTEREWKKYIPSETYQESEPCPEFPKAYD